MTDNRKTEELNDSELDQVTGGVGLLLPAVQAVRESASRSAVPQEKLTLGYEEVKVKY